MYWGILAVAGIAFSCSTEFIPELNEQLKLVKFTDAFRSTMTIVMVVDYVGCWIIERVLKAAFSDYKPKDIAIRRPEQLEKEQKRKHEEYLAREREKEIKAGKA